MHDSIESAGSLEGCMSRLRRRPGLDNKTAGQAWIAQTSPDRSSTECHIAIRNSFVTQNSADRHSKDNRHSLDTTTMDPMVPTRGSQRPRNRTRRRNYGGKRTHALHVRNPPAPGDLETDPHDRRNDLGGQQSGYADR